MLEDSNADLRFAFHYMGPVTFSLTSFSNGYWVNLRMFYVVAGLRTLLLDYRTNVRYKYELSRFHAIAVGMNSYFGSCLLNGR